MRNIIFYLASICSLIFTVVAPAQTVVAAPAPPYAVVTVPTLNVRAAPSIYAPVVGQVYADDRLSLLGRNSDGTWLRIESASGQGGWVFAEMTQPAVPITALSIYQLSATPTTSTNTASEQTQADTAQKVNYRPSGAAATTEASAAVTSPSVAPQPVNSVSRLPRPNEDPQPVGPTLPVNPPASSADPVDAKSTRLETVCIPTKLRSVSVGGRPQSVTASGDRLFVALANLNTLMVVDGGMDMMLGSSRTTAKKIDTVAATMDALYISDSEKERLIVTNRQGAVKKSIDLPAAPGPIAVTDGRAFVLHPQMGAVSVIDLNNGTILATLNIGPEPRQLAVVGGRAFIAHAAGFLSVVDGFGRRQEQLLLPINDVTGMEVNPRTGVIYVSSAADYKVVAIDVSTWTLVNTWQLDVMPSSLAFNDVTDHLFVLDTTSQFLTVLSNASDKPVGRVRVSQQPARDLGHNLALLQSKLYIMSSNQDYLDIWLDRTCASETVRQTVNVREEQVRTDLAPRQIEARIGILWPHGGADPSQATFANLTATLLREDGASPACNWEPKVTLWAAIGSEPIKQVAVGTRRMMTQDSVTFPVYDFNDVDIRATREEGVPIHFMVHVEGIQPVVNVWTHAASGQYIPAVRPELEGLVTRYSGDLDARLWVEQTADGPTIYAILMRAGTMLGLAPGATTVKPQLRWAVDNNVTEPELIVGTPETRQGDGVVYTVWRFEGSNPDSLLRSAAQARFWVEVPGVEVHSGIIAWGHDIRTLGARLPVPVVGCQD